MTHRSNGCRRRGFTRASLWLAMAFAMASCSPTDIDAPPADDQPDAPEVAIPSTIPAQGDESSAYPAPEDSAGPSGSATEMVQAEPAGSGAQSAPDAGAPRAGDMLNSEEMRAAEDLALESASGMLAAATDRDALGAAADLTALADQPTYRVMYVQRYQTKTEEPRSAEVAFYRYDTNEVVLSRVNLEDESVAQLPVPPGYLAPLLPEEIAEAARVARGDDQVAAYLAEVGLDPETAVANGLLTTAAGDESTACTDGRCVRLFFFDADHVVPSFTIVVDLRRVAVVEIAPMFPDQTSDQSAAEASDESTSEPTEEPAP